MNNKLRAINGVDREETPETCRRFADFKDSHSSAQDVTCGDGIMSKAKTSTALVLILLAAVLWQYQENRRLVRELATAREENTRLESAQTSPKPEQPVNESTSQREQELEAEVLRLRGVAARTTRADAEVARLKSELARRDAQSANANAGAVASDSLVQYLGAAVQAPANLEAAYTKEGLLDAINAAASKAAVSIKHVQVDDSEFPYLLGVVVSASTDWEKLKAQLRNLDGYEYHGAVGNDTRNAFSITPARTFPPGTDEYLHRRMTIRMQVLADQLNVQGN